MTSQNTPLLEAVAINRIACKETGDILGIEYRWNTGEIAILWRNGPSEHVIRQFIEQNNCVSD